MTLCSTCPSDVVPVTLSHVQNASILNPGSPEPPAARTPAARRNTGAYKYRGPACVQTDSVQEVRDPHKPRCLRASEDSTSSATIRRRTTARPQGRRIVKRSLLLVSTFPRRSKLRIPACTLIPHEDGTTTPRCGTYQVASRMPIPPGHCLHRGEILESQEQCRRTRKHGQGLGPTRRRGDTADTTST